MSLNAVAEPRDLVPAAHRHRRLGRSRAGVAASASRRSGRTSRRPTTTVAMIVSTSTMPAVPAIFSLVDRHGRTPGGAPAGGGRTASAGGATYGRSCSRRLAQARPAPPARCSAPARPSAPDRGSRAAPDRASGSASGRLSSASGRSTRVVSRVQARGSVSSQLEWPLPSRRRGAGRRPYHRGGPPGEVYDLPPPTDRPQAPRTPLGRGEPRALSSAEVVRADGPGSIRSARCPGRAPGRPTAGRRRGTAAAAAAALGADRRSACRRGSGQRDPAAGGRGVPGSWSGRRPAVGGWPRISAARVDVAVGGQRPALLLRIAPAWCARRATPSRRSRTPRPAATWPAAGQQAAAQRHTTGQLVADAVHGQQMHGRRGCGSIFLRRFITCMSIARSVM